MKNFKKALSLFAVTAFLTLALLPAAAMADDAVLPVLTTAASVTAGTADAAGAANEAAQYAALPTASAVIMPGQELQLQVTGSLPAAAPSDPPTRSGWYYGATVQDAAASGTAVPSAPALPSPGESAPPLTIRGTAAPAPTQAPGENTEGTENQQQSRAEEEPSAVPATDVQAGTTKGYAYVAGPYAPQTGSTAQTWWGGGLSVQCVQPALVWNGLYSSVAPSAQETPLSEITAGQTRYATVSWQGALPPVSAGSSTGNPAVSITVKDAAGNPARGLTCNPPDNPSGSSVQVQLVASPGIAGGEYTVDIAPRATIPAAIQSIASSQKIKVLGYALEAAPGGTTGIAGQPATSVVQWKAADTTATAGVPADAARLIYKWTAAQTPAPQFADGVYDPATGTITARTTQPLTGLSSPIQYTVQAYQPSAAGAPETAVGQPVMVTLGNISNYTLEPVAAQKNGVVAAVGSRGTSSVVWASGGAAQTPANPAALTYEWTATGTNAASAPAMLPEATPAADAIATAQTQSVLTPAQVGTYTYSVQAYEGTGASRTAVGNPAAVTMNVVVPQLEGDPAILRATIQTAPDKLLKARWSQDAAPTDPEWLANVVYTWTPQTEDPSSWPVVDVTTTQPSNALRSNFVGGNPNVYTWRVQAVYTDPVTGRTTNIGNPIDLELDLYSENVLVAAYETGTSFTARVGEKADMSVVWANGFVKTGETYTWTGSEGAPVLDPASTAMNVTTAATSLAQGGNTYTYTVQPYTMSGAPDGDPAKVELRIQPYLLKPADASMSVKVGEKTELEAAWSAEGGAALPAEDAQLTYVWSGPVPEGGPAVTGDGLKAEIAAPEEEGEWTYTLRAQTGTGTDATTIAEAQFVVTAVEDAPAVVPSLQPLTDSNVAISMVDDVKYIVGEGLTATASGHTVDDVIGLMDAPTQGYAIEIVPSNGGTAEGSSAIVGTGDRMQLVRQEDGEVIESAVIIVRGDVTGSGKISLTQLVQMAGALTGSLTLEGPNLMAADFDGSGGINLTDLVREAALYKNELMRPSDDPTSK